MQRTLHAITALATFGFYSNMMNQASDHNPLLWNLTDYSDQLAAYELQNYNDVNQYNMEGE